MSLVSVCAIGQHEQQRRLWRTRPRNYDRLFVEPLLLTALQAAQLLSVGRTSVYELIATGDLESVHIGRSMRIPADRVHEFCHAPSASPCDQTVTKR